MGGIKDEWVKSVPYVGKAPMLNTLNDHLWVYNARWVVYNIHDNMDGMSKRVDSNYWDVS